jgi:hypothetical protein
MAFVKTPYRGYLLQRDTLQRECQKLKTIFNQIIRILIFEKEGGKREHLSDCSLYAH